MTVVGPRSQETPFVLVDTGSDDIVFPLALAHRIGVDLANAPQRRSQGVGSSQSVMVQFAPVILQLSDGHQAARWRAIVGFTAAPMRFALFGMAGGLEFFRTTLDVVKGEIELAPNLTLPSTSDATP